MGKCLDNDDDAATTMTTMVQSLAEPQAQPITSVLWVFYCQIRTTWTIWGQATNYLENIDDD